MGGLADSGQLEHTVLTGFGVTNAWLAIAPFVAAVLTSVVLAVRATPSTSLSDFRFAVPALLRLGLRLGGRPGIDPGRSAPVNRGNASVALAGRLGRWCLPGDSQLVRLRERRAQPAPRSSGAREAALGRGLALEEPTS